jgi:hypothetical protein
MLTIAETSSSLSAPALWSRRLPAPRPQSPITMTLSRCQTAKKGGLRTNLARFEAANPGIRSSTS